MGNSSSTNQQEGGGSSRRHHHAAAAAPSAPHHIKPGDSPAMRQLRLSEDSVPGGSGPARKPSTSSSSSTRRRRSIDLHEQQHQPALLRRKQSGGRRTASIATVEDDQEPIAVEGTLRGAMQGKAEHVVYGPRRGSSHDAAAGGSNDSTAPPSPFVKPATIALPAPAVFAQFPVEKDIEGQPRLTSEVLLATEQMPVISSPPSDQPPSPSPFGPTSSTKTTPAGAKAASDVPRSLTGVANTIAAQASNEPLLSSDRLPPTSGSEPHPPTHQPSDTVLAPQIPTDALPLSQGDIPSGTGVIASPNRTAPGTPGTPALPSPTVLLPPSLLNAPVAAIPIPLLTVPSADVAANLRAAAVDLGAGPEGVPTLIKWKDEDASSRDTAKGPKEVYVTGTFAKGWKTKIELRKTDATDFSALISLPPGSHRLKFIVDKEWKASKHLPVATDADGNLINYLQVTGTATRHVPGFTEWQQNQLPMAGPWATDEDEEASSDEEDDEEWTQEIPAALVEWSEYENARENAPHDRLPPPPPTAGVAPPQLPAQLEKGPLNHAAYVAQGSGDDNSVLPKPEYSVINHLAASPIKGGMLSVGITTRYKRKFITTVFFKPISTPS